MYILCMKRKKTTGPKPKVTAAKLKQYLRDNRSASALQVAKHFKLTPQRIYQVASAAGVSWSTVTHRTVEGL